MDGRSTIFVETPRTTFTLAGRADNDATPTQLDLHVRAPRFAFQEWAGVLRGLKNIAVEASFETQLKGPLAHLDTTLRLGGTGGSVTGALVLDTTVPGWHGSGALDVDRVNLARWLSRPDRPSDFSGRVTFDLALELGQHFLAERIPSPDLTRRSWNARPTTCARGQITSREVLIAGATAVACGANVAVTSGSIGIDEPFPFRFAGTTTNTDLRRVPASVPVPHVDSLLAFAYDVSGRFSRPFIAGLRAGSSPTGVNNWPCASTPSLARNVTGSGTVSARVGNEAGTCSAGTCVPGCRSRATQARSPGGSTCRAPAPIAPC